MEKYAVDVEEITQALDKIEGYFILNLAILLFFLFITLGLVLKLWLCTSRSRGVDEDGYLSDFFHLKNNREKDNG